MPSISAGVAPEPSVKIPAWTPLRRGGKAEPAETVPSVSYAHAPVGIQSLDNVRLAFWQAFRHLFPPHSLAAQTPNGSIVISWSIMDEPHARYPYAAPVMLRFDEQLVDTMSKCDSRQRVRIAQNHEPTLREGLRGYDPFARFPNARVVVIG